MSIPRPVGHAGILAALQERHRRHGRGQRDALSLKPVTFHYKSDTKGIPQFGLIAEEVAEVNPDLVVRDGKGEIYSVRYEAVNAMLLNEFLKEHRKVEQQDRKIEDLESTVAKLQSALKEQVSQIQKVSDQLKGSKPAPQLVANP